eukprot:9102344-Alexandrium_andersonii.AAC.1
MPLRSTMSGCPGCASKLNMTQSRQQGQRVMLYARRGRRPGSNDRQVGQLQACPTQRDQCQADQLPKGALAAKQPWASCGRSALAQ